MSQTHPCLQCGACCAHFRVSFYWAEADDTSPEGVPVAMTAPLPPHRRLMRGTDTATPRCVALLGTVGEAVRCTIHPLRPNVCRDFAPSYEHGTGTHNPRCDAARAAWELPPLSPHDWGDPAPVLPPRRRLPRAA